MTPYQPSRAQRIVTLSRMADGARAALYAYMEGGPPDEVSAGIRERLRGYLDEISTLRSEERAERAAKYG